MGVERLDGWKAIASFLNRDERTVRRWEATRGLPVHRIPGGERPRIWADPQELRAWLSRGGADEEPTPPAPPKRRLGRVHTIALALALPVAGLAWYGAAREAPVPAPYVEDAQSRELYLRALFLWNGRTPEGIAEATRLFTQLAQRHPQRPEAYAKLADCYLLQREFGAMPERQAYAEAHVAAQEALKRDARSAAGLRALAFIRFWSDADPTALDLFARAAALDPASAQTHLWYANALSARARHEEAQAAFARARALDPNNPAILTDQAFDLLFAGRLNDAERLLRTVTAVQPGLSSAHRALSWLALKRGDFPAFFSEGREAARLRGDATAVAEFERLRQDANAADAVLKLAAHKEEQHRRTGYGAAEAAFLFAAAGEGAEASRALARLPGTPEAILLPVSTSFAGVR